MTMELLSMAQAAAGHAAEAAGAVHGNFHAAIVGFGAALGVGLVGSKAAEAVGRNPGAFGNILTISIIGMALAEGLGILAFFVVK